MAAAELLDVLSLTRLCVLAQEEEEKELLAHSAQIYKWLNFDVSRYQSFGTNNANISAQNRIYTLYVKRSRQKIPAGSNFYVVETGLCARFWLPDCRVWQFRRNLISADSFIWCGLSVVRCGFGLVTDMTDQTRQIRKIK